MCSKGNQVNETPAEELENHSENPNKNQETANQRLNEVQKMVQDTNEKISKGRETENKVRMKMKNLVTQIFKKSFGSLNDRLG